MSTVRLRQILVGAATVATVVIALGHTSAAQGPRFGGGGGGELELVDRFDADGNGWLDASERQAARRAAVNQGGGRQRFGRGFGRSGGGAPPEAGPLLTPADVQSYPDAHLYDLTTLRTILLQFEADDWEQELEAFYDTDVEVPARMIVDGQTYEDVGVHFRGQSSYGFVSTGYKRSLNLSLDFIHDDQRLGGYKTLNLLNAANDPTFVRPALYTEIARQYMPVPRMNFVRVVINGESWGIYLNAQQFNKDLARDYFGTEDGARWKVPGSPRAMAGLEYLGESPDAYRGRYEIKSKDKDESWQDLITLTRVLNQTPPDALEAALRPMLDVDGVLKFLALEVAMVNSDGYWSRASDYSIYQDPKGVFHIIPHDVNEALGVGGGGGGFGRGGGGAALDPLVCANDPSKPLCSKLLAVPELRTRYLGYVRDIAERWLDWSVIGPMAESYRALIADDVRADTRKLDSTQAFERGMSGIQQFVDSRRAFLLQR